jgi:hypoxanthine phosphoribosyltransferase
MRDVQIPEDAVHLSWEQAVDIAVDLADMVEDLHAQEPFDIMLVPPRGGFFPGLILSQRLGFDATRIISASISSYKAGAAEQAGTLTVGQFPTEAAVRGKRVLVVDEVCHTGDTLSWLEAKLMTLGAADVVSAVMHYKPKQSKTGYLPDLYATRNVEAWIVYPWERHDKYSSLFVPSRRQLPKVV